jgi:hypothetical protein
VLGFSPIDVEYQEVDVCLPQRGAFPSVLLYLIIFCLSEEYVVASQGPSLAVCDLWLPICDIRCLIQKPRDRIELG